MMQNESRTRFTDFSIVPFKADLLAGVVELEIECGLSSRGVEGYRKKMSNPNCVLLAAITRAGDRKPRIAGMFSGEVVVDELQIDNLAVMESFRRKGVGGNLLRTGIARARLLGATRAILEARAANLNARIFYEREGFVVIGSRKAYYTDPRDDAVLLSHEIDDGFVKVS
jgi:ribosomal-protein-alanine N-acetyltransferase